MNMYPTIITGTAILGVTGVKFITIPPTVAAVRIATIGRKSWGDTSTVDNNALRDLSHVRDFKCAGNTTRRTSQRQQEEIKKPRSTIKHTQK